MIHERRQFSCRIVPRGHARSRRRGLTLLELIVVLVILAALGTVAITQTAGLTGEARYQQTVRTMERLQDAVIGRDAFAGEDPTAVPAAFVADIGRLPQIGAQGNLAELYDLDDAGSLLPVYQARALTGLDDDLVLASGWRGPYIRRPLGSDEVRDGWGRAFTLRDPAGADIDTTTAAAATEIGSIVSLGVGAGDAFDIDLETVFTDTSDGLEFAELRVVDTDATPANETTLLFNLQYTGAGVTGGDSIVVRLYGAEDGLPAVVWQSDPLPVAATGFPETIAVELTEGDTIPVGPKLLRAYQWDSALVPDPGDEVGEANADLTARNKSQAVRVTVKAGGVWWPDLNMEGL